MPIEIPKNYTYNTYPAMDRENKRFLGGWAVFSAVIDADYIYQAMIKNPNFLVQHPLESALIIGMPWLFGVAMAVGFKAGRSRR